MILESADLVLHSHRYKRGLPNQSLIKVLYILRRGTSANAKDVLRKRAYRAIPASQYPERQRHIYRTKIAGPGGGYFHKNAEYKYEG